MTKPMKGLISHLIRLRKIWKVVIRNSNENNVDNNNNNNIKNKKKKGNKLGPFNYIVKNLLKIARSFNSFYK